VRVVSPGCCSMGFDDEVAEGSRLSSRNPSRIAIMQPAYLPWLGYFDLMDQADVFVLLDSVSFEKSSWQQRNRIKTAQGLQWLTVPVRRRFGQLISEVEIKTPAFWKKHLRALEINYHRTPYFQAYFPALGRVYEQAAESTRLVDLDIRLIEWLASTFGIGTPIVKSSTLKVQGKRTALVASICERLGCSTYLSPLGAAVYLLNELAEFSERGIEVLFHHYDHPFYRQLYEPFLSHASVIDLLFNEGERSLEVIQSGRQKSYLPDEVECSVARLDPAEKLT